MNPPLIRRNLATPIRWTQLRHITQPKLSSSQPKPKLTLPQPQSNLSLPKSLFGQEKRYFSKSSNDSKKIFEKVEWTKLPSGLRVVSIDTGRPLTSVGIFFRLGWQRESRDEAGATETLERLFSAVSQDWAYRDRATFQAGPEYSQLKGSFLRESFFTDFAPDLIIQLARFFFPQQKLSGIENMRQQAQDILQESDPLQLFHELFPFAALRGHPRGHTARFHQQRNKTGPHEQLIPVVEKLPAFSTTPPKSVLQKYVGRAVSHPGDVVIVGCDCLHGDLLKFASTLDECLADLRKPRTATQPPTPPVSLLLSPAITIYQSPRPQRTAQFSLMVDTTKLDCGLSQEEPNERSLAPAFMQTLLGGGDVFSSGGPGKGMFSRLHQRVLPFPGVETCVAVSMRTLEGSALGVVCDVLPDVFADCLKRVCVELGRVGKVTTAELNRVKNQLSFIMWAQLERAEGLIDEIGGQLILHTDWDYPKINPEWVQQGIDKMSKEIVRRAAAHLLEAPRSLVAMGDAKSLKQLLTDFDLKLG